jgi:hypothetical protein
MTTTITDSPKANARTYYALLGGMPLVEANNATNNAGWGIVGYDIHLKVGGAKATAYPYYQVSLYGRQSLNADDAVVFYRENCDPVEPSPHRRGHDATWADVHLTGLTNAVGIGCLVLRVEGVIEDYTQPPADTIGVKTFHDQFGMADPPPWGVQLISYRVFGSPTVKRNTTVHAILKDIINGQGPLQVDELPSENFQLAQLVFDQLPGTRLDAINTIMAMTGWDYACYDGVNVKFTSSGSGTVRTLDVRDSSTLWDYEEDVAETFNGVNVCFTGAHGAPRLAQAMCDPVLPSTKYAGMDPNETNTDRFDTITAPASVTSRAEALKLGHRYLRGGPNSGTTPKIGSHGKLYVQGSVTVVGDVGHDDALLFRPGDILKMTGPARRIFGKQKISKVTLHPLEWSADLQFGENSKLLGAWLARLAAGAKSIKRR